VLKILIPHTWTFTSRLSRSKNQTLKRIIARGFNFYGTGHDYTSLDDVSVYIDSNVNPAPYYGSKYSNTSNFVIDGNVNTKTNILSTEIRHGFSMTLNSIPHYGSITYSDGLSATLSFVLVDTDNENTIDITDSVRVYNGLTDCDNEIPKTIYINTWDCKYANQVYLDFSNLDLSDYELYTQTMTLINIYANVSVSSSTDYGNQNNILAWQLDLSNVNIGHLASDNLLIGNWKLVTGSNGNLLLQFKKDSDSNWITMQEINSPLTQC
jgi:hypothetical protein